MCRQSAPLDAFQRHRPDSDCRDGDWHLLNRDLDTDLTSDFTLTSFSYVRQVAVRGNLGMDELLLSDTEDARRQAWDVENRLVRVTRVPAHSAGADVISGGVTEMVYDGDGARVLTLYPDDTWSATPGPHLEVTGTVTRSYFFLGSQRIVMRVEVDGEDDEVYYFHTDHLGSIAAITEVFLDSYRLVDSARYLPFGGRRVELVNDPLHLLGRDGRAPL